MRIIATSTYLLMLLAVVGSSHAVDDRSETVDCAWQIEREFRNPNHRARRIYSAARTDGNYCITEEQQ